MEADVEGLVAHFQSGDLLKAAVLACYDKHIASPSAAPAGEAAEAREAPGQTADE